MPRSRRTPITPLAATLLALAVPVIAQQGAVAFKNFHRYPAGQWHTEAQATRNGSPMGAPMVQTSCTNTFSPTTLDAMTRMGNNAAPTCKIHILTDEPRNAAFEQLCTFGPSVQTSNVALHAIDDKTVTTDMSSNMGTQAVIVVHATSHFLGACTPAQQAAANDAATHSPLGPKPSAEDCAQLPQARQQTQAALQSCSQMPEAYRADYAARVQGSLRTIDQMQQACR